MTRPRRATALAALLILILILIAVPVGPRLGSWLVAEDPLQKADAIYVLGGTRLERPLEAADLYKEGWAPHILLSHQVDDGGEVALKKRGIPYPGEADLQRSILGTVGVPLDAIDILQDEQVSTSEEARSLLAHATERQWTRIIVVTSKMHTRRARLSMRRQLARRGIELIARGSRYDTMDPDHWWRDRDDLRFTLFEYQKLALYGYVWRTDLRRLAALGVGSRLRRSWARSLRSRVGMLATLACQLSLRHCDPQAAKAASLRRERIERADEPRSGEPTPSDARRLAIAIAFRVCAVSKSAPHPRAKRAYTRTK